jgi:hypothetical protein
VEATSPNTPTLLRIATPMTISTIPAL